MLLTAFPAPLLTAAVLEGWGGMAWGWSVCLAGGKHPGMAAGSSLCPLHGRLPEGAWRIHALGLLCWWSCVSFLFCPTQAPNQ